MSSNVTHGDDVDVTSLMHTERPYQDYWQFRTYIYMLKYGAGVIIMLGVFGNLLTLIVLQSKSYRASPSTIVLSTLAISDLGYVVCGLIRHWIIGLTDFRLDIRNLNVYSCKLTTFSTYVFKHSSACLLALVTIERMLSVLFPLRCKELITRKRLATVVLLLMVTLIGIDCFMLYTLDLDPEDRIPCTERSEHLWYWDSIYIWIDAILSNILPFITIFSCNLVIIGKLAAARARRKIMQASEKKSNSTTVMLTAVGIVFLLTTTPKAIYYFGFSYNVWPKTSNQSWARIYLAYIITTLLVFVNSAVNFILYCLTGSKFRAAFRDVFGLKMKSNYLSEQSSNVHNTSISTVSKHSEPNASP